MKNKTKGAIIKCCGIAIDVVAPLGATISQFPLWIQKSSSATVSGLFLVFALLSTIPFIAQIKEWLKSPSVPVLWGIFLVLAITLRNIIDQMVMICLIGAIGNIIGAIIYKVGEGVMEKPDIPKEFEEEPQEVE